MTNNDWRISIENAAEEVAAIASVDAVKFVYQNHNGRCLEDINPADYPEVFSELYEYIENAQ